MRSPIFIESNLHVQCELSGMVELTSEDHSIRRAVSGYGLEVSGGSESQRKKALDERLSNPIITVNVANIEDMESFNNSLLKSLGYNDEEIKGIVGKGAFEVKEGLNQTGSSILVHNFDNAPSEVQKSIAQQIKGFAEQIDDQVQFGFTSDEGEAVVRANPDLSGRVLHTRVANQDS